ncbi:hypothetical protein [Parabacteroides goldsteinii]|uniref:hypothetical protein n=1 Tax=Parabacteroides goldsteinii TaxID=328812 RepID=UPI001CCE0145|nr:hypothetical protein [Parabacteroides goldsteinii]UBD72684.1 hypothetical protein K6V26_16025 [Parabacteroides goldsteinii]
MTAKELYDSIISQKISTETCICRLHHPCSATSICGQNSQITVIDFDGVKDTIDKQKKRESYSSVDALTYKQNNLLFVEIKGWKEFISHNTKISNTKIQKQVDRFDLKKKLLDSISICCDLTNDPDFLIDKPSIYVIVTDIDPTRNGLGTLAMNLNVLANTTSQWELVCIQLMNECIAGISEMKTHYLYCEDFDNYYQGL